MIPKPTSVTPLPKKRLVRYSFDTGPRMRDMYVRGSIAWPAGGLAGAVPGYALIAGQDIKTGIVYIFDEYAAQTHEPLYNEAKHKEIGFKLFFNNAWSRFGCRTFFYQENELVHKHWAGQVYKDLLLRPFRNSFIRTPFDDVEIADNIIHERFHTDMLKASAQSDLFNHYKNVDSRQRHALRCLMVGYARHPWIDYSKDRELIEYWLK